MRILQANTYHYVRGGAERYYLDLSRELEQRGHVVIPLAARYPSNESTPYERYFIRGVDYREPLTLTQRLREAVSAVYNRETVQQVRAVVEHERPEVAHFHNIYHNLSPSLISSLAKLRVPMVQTLHDYKIICPGYLLMTQGEICERCKGKRFLNAVRYRCLLDSYAVSLVGFAEATLHSLLHTFEKIARFLCPSRFLLEKVAEFGLPREKLLHFPYFLPAHRYQPRFTGSDYFVYVGRLSREKGIQTLLAALQRREGSRLTCRIVGEGPLEEMLRTQAMEWGLRNVEFSGYLSGQKLHDMIGNAAFTVVPSEWYENQPFAVLESFALGTPVVGSRIGGIPEMVLDERTGYTFPPGDADALAALLDRMEKLGDQAVAMGREARKLVETQHDTVAHLERMEALYREVSA